MIKFLALTVLCSALVLPLQAEALKSVYDSRNYSANIATKVQMIEQVKPQAEQRIKSRLVLEAVVAAEKIEATEADFEDAKLSFQQSMITALNEIDRYYKGLGNASQQLENERKTLEANRQIEAYRKARYELGADELKDWLDALRSLNSSRLAVLEAKYSVISASNAVFQALGGRISAR